jgi:hypothetical protein
MSGTGKFAFFNDVDTFGGQQGTFQQIITLAN